MGQKKKATDDLVDENGYTTFRKTFLFNNLLMGGETLNSLQSYICSVTGYSEKYLSTKYAIRSIEVQNMLLKNDLGQNCASNFYIGNYVMVPAYFNGSVKGIQDRRVTRIPMLKKDWSSVERLLNRYHDKERYNRRIAYSREELNKLCKEQHYEDYSGDDFPKYINTMFLWDYVQKNSNEYEVKSDENTNIEYLWMCNYRIKRRSLFMTAMLKIAIELPKGNIEKHSEWNNWNVSIIYKDIMEMIFIKGDCYASYDEVLEKIDKLESVNNDSKVAKILREVKDLIDKVN